MTSVQKRTILFLLAAFVLFALATLIAADWLIHSGNYAALLAGGLLSLTAAALSERLP